MALAPRASAVLHDLERRREPAQQQLRAADRLRAPWRAAGRAGAAGASRSTRSTTAPGARSCCPAKARPAARTTKALVLLTRARLREIEPVDVRERHHLHREREAEGVEDGVAQVEAREVHARSLPGAGPVILPPDAAEPASRAASPLRLAHRRRSHAECAGAGAGRAPRRGRAHPRSHALESDAARASPTRRPRSSPRSPSPAALRYEPEPRGLPAARAAISAYYAARGESRRRGGPAR